MRAWVIRSTGGLDRLEIADVPDPAGPIEARQVRIALRAAALNRLDLFVVRGLPHEYDYPHILGADGAGVVETVLVWGIGGGVSLAALRLAKLKGARVIVTSSSDAKLHAAQQLGADVTLNHKTRKISQEVRALTDKRGADVVIENVGEATWDESLRALARGGRLVSCGATTGPKVGVDMRRLFWHQWSILGSTMGNDAEYREIVRVLASGELRPIVDRVFPFAEARAAFERLERGEQLGKIAVAISPA